MEKPPPVSTATNRRDWVLVIIDFIWSLITLLINILIWLFSSIWKFASQIFNWDLFDYVNDTYLVLANFIWSAWASILMGLMGLAFTFIIFQFIMRVLRGRINYNSSLKKINKYK